MRTLPGTPRLFGFLCTALFLLLTGCVPDRIWQPVTTPPAPPALITTVNPANTSSNKHPYIAVQPVDGPQNHATVEFFDDGSLADACTSKPNTTARLCQLTYASDFIRRARRNAASSVGAKVHVVVVGFIHGNENNASVKSDNYPHFEQLINCLNLGSQAYSVKYSALIADNTSRGESKQRYLDCEGVAVPVNRQYVGIYFGWRGALLKGPINLQQNAAMRIGKAHPVVHSLFTLRDAAKDNTTKDVATFILLGHSFGGLLLEQASTQIFQTAYTSNDKSDDAVFNTCDSGTGPSRGYKPFTDLVVTINEAVNAIPAKKLIDFFQTKGESFCSSSDLAPALKRPLLISLHSKSDAFTGRLGTRLRYIVPPRGGLRAGYFPPDSTYPLGAPWWYIMTHSTPANIPYFQNLCYIDLDPAIPTESTGEIRCDRVSDITKTRASFDLAFPKAAPNKALDHLYVRYDCKSSFSNNAEDKREPCESNDPSQGKAGNLHIFNRSPYWLLSVDDMVISGHNDFWNDTLISLVGGMASSLDPLKPSEVMAEPSVFRH